MRDKAEDLINNYILCANDEDALGARILALVCFDEIDKDKGTPIELAQYTVQGLTHLARRLLREAYSLDHEEIIQETFEFVGKLQSRYSVRRDGDDEYVSVSFLTDIELTTLADNYMKISDAYKNHGLALYTYRDKRKPALSIVN